MTAEEQPAAVTATTLAEPNWRAVVAHVVPFIVWLLLLQALGEPAGWKYAVRTAVGVGLLVWARPWKYYPVGGLAHLPLALAAGLAVLAVWVFPELPFPGRWWSVQEWYLRFGVTPLGHLDKGYPDPSPYAPAVCGWPLSLVRLAGSAFVIAVIEEYFWRGFLYRWLIHADFRKVSLREFDLRAFLIMVALFGVEHDRWFVGALAGAAFGGLVLWTGRLWPAILAHVLTNFVLGLYVLGYGDYGFW